MRGDDLPTSTPLTIGRDGQTDPRSLYDFLGELLGSVRGNPSPEQREAYPTLLISLSENFIARFPVPNLRPWSSHAETTKLTERSLAVICQICTRVHGLLSANRKVVDTVLSALLHLSCTLDMWISADQKSPFPEPANSKSPAGLKDMSNQCAVTVIMSAAVDSKAPGKETRPGVMTLRDLLLDYTAAIKELCNHADVSKDLICLNVFSCPRIKQGTSLDDPFESSDPFQGEVKLKAPLQVIRASLTLLFIASSILEQPLSYRVLLYDVERLLAELLSNCFNTLIIRLSDRATRHSILTDYLSCVLKLTKVSATAIKLLTPSIQQAFSSRLSENPYDISPQLDEVLLRCTEGWMTGLTDCRQFAERMLILLQTNGHADCTAYFKICLEQLAKFVPRVSCEVERTETTVVPSASASQLLIMEPNDLDCSAAHIARRVEELIGGTTAFESMQWPPDAEKLSPESWTLSLLALVSDRTRRSDLSDAEFLHVCHLVKLVPCCLVHPATRRCDRRSKLWSQVSLEWLELMSFLLDRAAVTQNDTAIASQLRGLGVGILHWNNILESPTFPVCMQIVQASLSSSCREVRLAAGRSVSDILEASILSRPDFMDLPEACFRRLANIMTDGQPMACESSLVTLGFIGKTSSELLQRKAFQLLIANIGSENPILRGLAYAQLKQLASLRGKSPYNLLSPFLSTLSVEILAHVSSKPALLPETCRFLSLSAVDLLSRTLGFTLPHFVAKRNLVVLGRLAQELSTSVSKLLLPFMQEILLEIFLLSQSREVEKSASFVVKVLRDAAPSEKHSVTLTAIVKSCHVSLLADLVISLGSETQLDCEAAELALMRVNQVFSGGNLADSRITPEATMSTFLRPHLLGVLTYMNDILQDVRGRKPIEMKTRVLRGLARLIRIVGPSISIVSPQIMSAMHSMICLDRVADAAVETWGDFVVSVELHDLAPNIGGISAGIISAWANLSDTGQKSARRTLEYIVVRHGADMGTYLQDVVDLTDIAGLELAAKHLAAARHRRSLASLLSTLIERASHDNSAVALRALLELKSMMLTHDDWFRQLADGDVFDSQVANVIDALFQATCRDGEVHEQLRHLAFECLGCLGALDPDRMDLLFPSQGFILIHNFDDETEAMAFAMHLIRDVLIGSFRSTSDTKHQSLLAFTIQELLKFCGFGPELVTSGESSSIPLKVRNRWSTLPKHMLETVAPLLESKFQVGEKDISPKTLPVYPFVPTYREWLQQLTAHLITRVSGKRAHQVFAAFRSAVRNRDVGVARHILPHLVLNVLIDSSSEDAVSIKEEIVAVLSDQVNPATRSTPEKRILSAQVIFSLMDHFNSWMRRVRQELHRKRDPKRSRDFDSILVGQLTRIDSILSGVDEELVGKAAYECKAYARSLMSYENQIRVRRSRKIPESSLQEYFDRMHQIYSHLDEPDGMEGISKLILEPSLEHQIRHHESMGDWTSAQSCWEVCLQGYPSKLDHHLGLLRCLRNLGHYDTLLTHISGLLNRNPEWYSRLVDFNVEGSVMVGDWSRVQEVLDNANLTSPPVVFAKAMLAMRKGDEELLSRTLTSGFASLGSPISAAGRYSYRRSYESMVNLHLLHELKMFNDGISANSNSSALPDDHTASLPLATKLKQRFDALLPSYRIQEPVLSLRRIALSSTTQPLELKAEIAQSWLDTAKISRKAKHAQTAYSAILHARQMKAPFSFVQQCKLIKESGEPLRALHELESAIAHTISAPEADGILSQNLRAATMRTKSLLLRAKWMSEADRFPYNDVTKAFTEVSLEAPEWESAHFHLGNHQDRSEKNAKDLPSVLNVVKSYAQALRYGSKFIFQTVPRLLTIWLDLGASDGILKADKLPSRSRDEFWMRIQREIHSAIQDVPVWKWMTAFPQIVSRIGHDNPEVVHHLSSLITKVIEEYPHQALWLLMSAVKSQKRERERRGMHIIAAVKGTTASQLAKQCIAMTTQLLELCDYTLKDNEQLTVSRTFPRLAKLVPSELIIPLQESLFVTLPPSSARDASHKPFPPGIPTIQKFGEEIEIMKSLQKPRKLTIIGDDGQLYRFLAKPKDDLRKDARLMDFSTIINKLLKKNSESRKRQLRIRTYGVVTLNEECGLVQWVPHTTPLRPVLTASYEQRNIQPWSRELNELFAKVKTSSDIEAVAIFTEQVLTIYPPVFHEWFLATFPEPTAWLASRLAFGRTAAVMSMVGFILGLGDRHCENILLDMNSGDVVHVDLNCLFEKGKSLDTPERIPFRLTQNIVDGLGVTGVEGVFRIACEITLHLLRENQDILMSVLDAFIHDPLVEWEDEKRRNERREAKDEERRRKAAARRGRAAVPAQAETLANTVRPMVDLSSLARNSLDPIKRKLQCISSTVPFDSKGVEDKEVNISNMVEALIREATDLVNLARAYTGWTPWL